jgi:hypothetical protein
MRLFMSPKGCGREPAPTSGGGKSMLQGLCRREPGRFGAPPRWLRSERAATWAALTVAALGFGLSVLIALFGR